MTNIYSINYSKPGKVFILVSSCPGLNFNPENSSKFNIDIELIEKTFGNLGYFINKNASLDEIQTSNFSNDSCVIVFILSNSDLEKLCDYNGKIVCARQFFDAFCQNEQLRDKPKLFFIDATRVENATRVKEIDYLDFFGKKEEFKQNDVLIEYAIDENSQSHNHSTSSVYISKICNLINDQCHEIDQVLLAVNNFVLNESKIKIYVKNGLRKKFFFKKYDNLSDKNKKYSCIKTFEGHADSVCCLQFIDQNTLVSGSDDCSIKIWDLNHNTCVKTFTGHTNWVLCIVLLNNFTIASGSGDNTIKIWDLEKNTCVNLLENETILVRCFQLIDKNRLAIGNEDFTIQVWNIEKKTCLLTLDEHKDSVRCLQNLGNNLLASGSCDNTIKIWSLINFNCVNTLRGHKYSVWCLEILDENKLASGSDDFTIKIWNIFSADCICTLEGHTNSVWCLKLINNDLLASGSGDNTIKIWDLKNKICVNTLEGHIGSVCSLQIFGNQTLASGSDDKTIKIWSLLS